MTDEAMTAVERTIGQIEVRYNRRREEILANGRSATMSGIEYFPKPWKDLDMTDEWEVIVVRTALTWDEAKQEHDPATALTLARQSVGVGMWQPIETAPKDKDVLLFVPTGVCTKVFVGYWDDDMDGMWLTPEGGEIIRISGHPTHWMPLPNPPSRSSSPD